MNQSVFTCKGSAWMETTPDGFRFTVTSAPPRNFRHKNAVVRSYVEADGVFRLPLRIDMTVSLDAPGFCVLLGDSGRVHFCSMWNDGRRIEDIAEPPMEGKSMFYANQMPLNTPTNITIIYNLKSMQVLIGGEQRYYSTKERYMKSKAFPELNAAGLKLRLTCLKRTGVSVHAFSVTESGTDFKIAKQDAMPESVMCNVALRPGDKPSYDNIVAALGEKPAFDNVITHLPEDIRAKVVEVDAFLRAYKPVKFKRSIEKNGNKITYLASDEGVSYMINLSRDMLTHTLEWYLLANSKETWGTRKADNLVATLTKLAAEDAVFAERIFSYLRDCTGCYGPDCMARSPYTFGGKTRQSCHGKIEFKMALSEFDDALRLIRAIR